MGIGLVISAMHQRQLGQRNSMIQTNGQSGCVALQIPASKQPFLSPDFQSLNKKLRLALLIKQCLEPI